MDPGARRFMWDVISKVSTQEGLCSVILTTHSLEEAEALCTRIGVMVNGRLRCLGSATHLKERFGNGFEVNLKTRGITSSSINNFISSQHGLFSNSPMKGRILLNEIEKLCISLGQPTRAQLISPNLDGRLLYDILQVEGSIPLEVFAEWWLTENQAEEIAQFFKRLDSIGSETLLLERSTAHSFRYRIQTPNTTDISVLKEFSLGNIFDKFESVKEKLDIQEYSVGQTTLEQVFNQFAASQDNPEVEAAQINQLKPNQQSNPSLSDNQSDGLLKPLLQEF